MSGYVISDIGSVSTTKDQVLPNWFTKSVREMSQRLSLPSKIDFADSVTNCSNRFVKKMESQSWFVLLQRELVVSKKSKKKENYRKTYCPLLTCSLQDKMEKGLPTLDKSDRKPNPNSMVKVKLYPTKSQKGLLNLIMKANRWGYNLLIEKVGDKLFENGSKELIKAREFVKKKNIPENLIVSKAPEDVFNSAFRDLKKARSSTLALSKSQKKRTGKGFICKQLKFRRIKDISQSIEIRSRSITYLKETSQLRFYPKYFNLKKGEGIRIKTKNLPDIEYSCRIQRNYDTYYLNIPVYKVFKQSKTKKVCAIDPGVRTMLTGFEPNGTVFEIGSGDISKIEKRYLLIDNLKSNLNKIRNKSKRYRLRKRIKAIYKKIKRMINDLHHKVSKWLSLNYKEVLLPSFEVKKMTSKTKRNIGKPTVRRMLAWGHYNFKMLLKYKMERTGGTLIDCTEEYTSKACTRCGRLNHNLGSSKIFKCSFSDCLLEIDRDVNGSRNIFLKNCNLLKTNWEAGYELQVL